MAWNPSVLKSARVLAALILLSSHSVCSSASDEDIRGAILLNQLGLLEHSSVLSQHSVALTKILESLSQQDHHIQGHTQAINGLSQGIESLIEVQREHSSTINKLTQGHLQAMSHLSQGMQSLIQAQKEQSTAINQMTQGHTQVISDLTQGMQSLSEALLSVQRGQSESISKVQREFADAFTEIQRQQSTNIDDILTEQTQAIRNVSVILAETLGNIHEASGQQYVNPNEKGCLKDDGQHIPHGHRFGHGCEVLVCLNGNLNRELAPEGFQSVSDGCYKPFHEIGTKYWEPARNYCLELGYDLSKPPSDMKVFTQFLEDLKGESWWWMGATKNDDGGFTYIKDKSPVNPTHWNEGQPDGIGGCLDFRPTYEGPLSENECASNSLIVCQWN